MQKIIKDGDFFEFIDDKTLDKRMKAGTAEEIPDMPFAFLGVVKKRRKATKKRAAKQTYKTRDMEAQNKTGDE